MDTRADADRPGREDAAVRARSVELHKELSVRDLAIAQIFALKIIGLIVATNVVGVALYVTNRKVAEKEESQ